MTQTSGAPSGEGRTPDELSAPDGDGTAASVLDTSLVTFSRNRLRALKALQERRKTASELARELELTKSTTHGYLQDLVEDGLVERYEDERLWVYYGLSERGRALVRRDKLTLILDISTLLSILGAGAVGLYRFVVPTQGGGGGAGALGGPDPGASQGLPLLLIVYVALILLALAGWSLHIYLARRDPAEAV